MIPYFREFDPGSGRTLAACLTHASRTESYPTRSPLGKGKEPASKRGRRAGKGEAKKKEALHAF